MEVEELGKREKGERKTQALWQNWSEKGVCEMETRSLILHEMELTVDMASCQSNIWQCKIKSLPDTDQMPFTGVWNN